MKTRILKLCTALLITVMTVICVLPTAGIADDTVETDDIMITTDVHITPASGSVGISFRIESTTGFRFTSSGFALRKADSSDAYWTSFSYNDNPSQKFYSFIGSSIYSGLKLETQYEYYFQLILLDGSVITTPLKTFVIPSKECSHENHDNDTYVSTEYRSIDSSVVHEKRDVYSHSCTDCGESLPNVYSDWSEEAHVFTDGVCVCGAQEAACSHTNYTPNDVYIEGSELVFEDNHDGATHQVKDQFNRYCGNCGEWLCIVLNEGKTQPHTFTDGVCVCGALEVACPHTNVLPTWDPNGQTIFPANMITDTHHGVENPYQMICQDCGAATGVTGYFPAETKEHDFSAGNVCACGYDRATNCVHVYAVNMDKPVQNTGVYTHNTVMHTRIACDYEQYCTICGTRGPDLTVAEAIDGMHWYRDDSYGYDEEQHWHQWITCQGCGYERARGYTDHTLNSGTRTETEYYSDGVNSHTVITTTYAACACGYEEAIDIKTDISGHVDHDDDGNCELCGGEDHSLPSDPEARKELFYELLTRVENNEISASDERISQIIRTLYQEAGFDVEYTDEILAVIDSADTPYKELYLFTIYAYSLKYIDNITVSGYFSSQSNTLIMGFGDVANEFLGSDFALTFFHECAHAIDFNAAWATYSQDLANALWEDATNIIKDRITSVVMNDSSLILSQDEIEHVVNAILGSDTTVVAIGPFYWNTVPENLSKKEGEVFAKVVSQLNSELAAADVNNASMQIDVLNALSNHTLHDWVVNGHDMDYWYNDDGTLRVTVMAEAWAEFFAAKITGYTEQDDLNCEYFPTACEIMETLAWELLETYKEMMLNTP